VVRIVIIWFALVFSNSVFAKPLVLSGPQIAKLLTGNTITGKWNGTEYRQYFSDDGTTIYATRKSQSSLGLWRVRDHLQAYESWWKGSGWSAYAILKSDVGLLWSNGAGIEYPFKVLPGQKLVWPQ